MESPSQMKLRFGLWRALTPTRAMSRCQYLLTRDQRAILCLLSKKETEEFIKLTVTNFQSVTLSASIGKASPTGTKSWWCGRATRIREPPSQSTKSSVSLRVIPTTGETWYNLQTQFFRPQITTWRFWSHFLQTDLLLLSSSTPIGWLIKDNQCVQTSTVEKL